MLAREAKRKKLVSRYAEKRKSILNELKKADTLEQIFELNEKLQKLPLKRYTWVIEMAVLNLDCEICTFISKYEKNEKNIVKNK